MSAYNHADREMPLVNKGYCDKIKTEIKKRKVFHVNTEVKDYIVGKTRELMEAASCSEEAKEAAQAWLDAVGTAAEAEETKKFISELEQDIMPLDGLIAFAESAMGAKVFGDAAGGVAEHARQIKAAGAKYCDCPACAAVEAILEKREEMLAD